MAKKKVGTDLVVWLVAVLVAVSLLNNYFLQSTLKGLAGATEVEEPANLEFTKIIDSSCTKCFNVSNIVHAIKALNVNAPDTEILEYNSAEAKELISKYNIKKIPVLIVSGELDKLPIWNQLPGETVDGVFVLNEPLPPYKNLETNKIEGLVTFITLTDTSCTTCYKVENHKTAVSAYGLYLDSELSYDISSAEGKSYLKKYNITIAPTVLISPEASAYTGLKTDWEKLNLGTVESDGWYVFRNTDILGRWGNYTTLS